jgi:hypothetical protein
MQERISIMNQGENGLETNGYAERIRKEGKTVTESLVYERLLDTQKATNLFHSVTIFRESGNIEFCVVGDNVLRHRVVGVEILIYGLIHFTSFHTVRCSRSSL